MEMQIQGTTKTERYKCVNTFKTDKILGLKTFKNTYLAWAQGLSNFVSAKIEAI